jgi:hypothetical protein
MELALPDTSVLVLAHPFIFGYPYSIHGFGSPLCKVYANTLEKTETSTTSFAKGLRRVEKKRCHVEVCEVARIYIHNGYIYSGYVHV